MKDVKSNLMNKATLKNLADVKEEMKALATKDDYQHVKEHIAKFEQALSKFKLDMSMFGQILRRYDEVLSEKASKINLMELEGNMRTQLKRIDVVGDIERKIDQLTEYVHTVKSETDVHFEMINKTISVEIMNAVKKAIK